MCDIYTERCIICGKEIPWHLGGFKTGKDEIVVACGEHFLFRCFLKEKHIPYYIVTMLPRDPEAVSYFIMKAVRDPDANYYKKKVLTHKLENEWIGKSIVVIPLTENAKRNARLNRPNLSLEMEYVFVNWDDGFYDNWENARYSNRFNWDETGWWGE